MNEQTEKATATLLRIHNMKNEIRREFPVMLLPIHSCDGQTPLNDRYEAYEILNPHSVQTEP